MAELSRAETDRLFEAAYAALHAALPLNVHFAVAMFKVDGGRVDGLGVVRSCEKEDAAAVMEAMAGELRQPRLADVEARGSC